MDSIDSISEQIVIEGNRRGKLLRVTVLVDSEDYIWLSTKPFVPHPGNGHKLVYASTQIKKEDGRYRTVLMHRLIMEYHYGPIEPGKQVDHINGNTCDNRKVNLRIVTGSQNQQNKQRKFNKKTSQYKGVYKCLRSLRYTAELVVGGKKHRGGTYVSERDAAIAYNLLACKFCGEFARLNEVGQTVADEQRIQAAICAVKQRTVLT